MPTIGRICLPRVGNRAASSWRASADDGVALLGQSEVIALSRMGESLTGTLKPA